eukprot:jgi/Chrzof1/5608/Cz16g08290.t1
MAAYTVLALQVLQTLLPPAWHYQHTNIHQSGERRQGFQPCRIQHMQAYLWPNLQLNTKSNPLFKHLQIDLYDPLRIQHESLPDHL